MERAAESRTFDRVWFLVWAVASSAWCLTASARLSATFDEPVYVARGLEFWRTGSHAGLMKLGTMPLPVDWFTLPAYLWERWHGTTLDPVSDLHLILPWARAATLLFWWLLLVYGRLAGRQLAGPWGGRLAVALLACEPNLLAHAALATTDLAVTACLLALVYHFRTRREASWWPRVGVPALLYGAAVLAKASGLVYGPLCLLAVELERAGRGPDGRWRLANLSPSGFRPFARDAAQILAVGLALVFVYCGCDWRASPSFVAWAHQLPDGPARGPAVWLAENLRVFSNAGEGLARQIQHNLRGHDVFLLGAARPRAVWYYFPVALTIKSGLALLALPLLVATARPRALGNWACAAALALLVFSLNCRVQIGIRFMLPLLALASVGLAAAVVAAARAAAPVAGACLRWGAAAGVLWSAASAAAVWPHGLCFTNELWGGEAAGYRLLSDSNYDWGQGLKELARWQREHGVEELDVWYFGVDPALKTLPMREVPFHQLGIASPAEVPGRVRGRYLAVGTTLLYGAVCHTESHRRTAEFLAGRAPADRAATFLIYDLGTEE